MLFNSHSKGARNVNGGRDHRLRPTVMALRSGMSWMSITAPARRPCRCCAECGSPDPKIPVLVADRPHTGSVGKPGHVAGML